MQAELLGVPFTVWNKDEWEEGAMKALQGTRTELWVTPNPEMVLLALKQPAFLELLQGADVSLVDGVGIVWALKRQSAERHERLSGADTLSMLARQSAKLGGTVLLIGGKGENAKRAAEALMRQVPGSNVIGVNPGEVKQTGEDAWKFDGALIDEIHAIKPMVIAAGLSMGKQEAWLSFIQPFVPSARVLIGVGGAFEMLSGAVPRAPKLLRRMGLEWAWRLLLEPSRLPRIFRAVIVFPLVVLWGRKNS